MTLTAHDAIENAAQMALLIACGALQLAALLELIP